MWQSEVWYVAVQVVVRVEQPRVCGKKDRVDRAYTPNVQTQQTLHFLARSLRGS